MVTGCTEYIQAIIFIGASAEHVLDAKKRPPLSHLSVFLSNQETVKVFYATSQPTCQSEG